MFKVISAEIKKIVSKPGIYILSVLLAVVLVLGVLIYKPTVKESTYFELKGNSYIEKYTEFTAGENAGKKAESKTKLNNSVNAIKNYYVEYNGETLTQKEYINVLLKKIDELFGEYQDCSSDASDEDDIITIRSQLVTSYEELNDAIETAVVTNPKNHSYSIITTKQNYEDYSSLYEQVLNWAKVNAKKEDITNHIIDFENKYAEKFEECLNNFKYPTLSKDFVKTYPCLENDTKYSILTERLNKIEIQIEEHKNLANADESYNNKNVDKMDELANLYVDTINTYTELIKYELITNAYSNISTSESLKMLYLSDYSNYNAKSLLERYNYLFEHNKVERDYGKPLTIGITSNDKINAYDYSYFVLKVFSFVIIIYAIMSACHSIAGEIKEGSMRYLAIRPVSRTTLFFGKWLSIIAMSSILMLFSTVISLCVGGAVYGFNSNTILTTFNGISAFTIHPLGMIAIYLFSMFFELTIYSLIAMLFSVLFKSDLISMTILLVVYLLNTLLPMFVQGANTWLAFYPFSHISLYSLFGSSLFADSNNLFNLIFGSKVYAGTHIALTASIIILLSVIISAIAVKIFKNKEL